MVGVGATLDALTVSLRREAAEWSFHSLRRWLRARGLNHVGEPGKPGRGFAASESFKLSEIVDSAILWRRYGPVAGSRELGPDYECWEVNGPGTQVLAGFLMEHPERVGRASRVDVAFDFACDADYWPAHVEREITDHAEHCGFSINYQGERDTRTVYVGSRQSGRMLRIYRHDLCHGGGVPLMRVELEAKKQLARDIWDYWEPSGGVGLMIAAWHVAGLTGRRPQDEVRETELEAAREKHLIRAAAAAVKSYGAVLRAYGAAGGDLAELLRGARKPDDREQRRREQLYQRSVEGWSSERLTDAVLRELRGLPPRPPDPEKPGPAS